MGDNLLYDVPIIMEGKSDAAKPMDPWDFIGLGGASRRMRRGWWGRIVFPAVEDGVLGASAIFYGQHPVGSFERLARV